jgi:hypothetical protein
MADETPEPTPKRSRKDKEALPFSEDTEQLDGRAWNRKPLVVIGVVIAAVIVIAVIVLAGNDLASDGGGGGSDGTVPAPIPTTTTTTSTTQPPLTTTSTTTPPPTTEDDGIDPGDECSPEEGNPDCVDPEGDGVYNLIIGAAECLETATDPITCADNDGDGDAGPAVAPT